MTCEANSDFERIIQQKKDRALTNQPNTRFSLISPYTNYVFNDDGTVNNSGSKTGYTKSQLDMRRKVEILKHDKTNGKQTSSQRYVSLMKGVGRRVSINTAQNISTLTQCDLIPKPLSASNVPPSRNENGRRNQMLVLDPTVPLYNYNVNVNIFPNDNDVNKNNDFYRFHKYKQEEVEYPFDTEKRSYSSSFSMSEAVQFGYLEFLDNIPETISTVTVSTDFFVRFSDISLNESDIIKYSIAIDNNNNNNNNPLKVFFSGQELSADENISYSSVTFSTYIIEISGNNLDTNINSEYTHDIGFTLTNVFDIPSDNGIIYALKYQFSDITLNPILNASTKVSFVSMSSNTTLFVT